MYRKYAVALLIISLLVIGGVAVSAQGGRGNGNGRGGNGNGTSPGVTCTDPATCTADPQANNDGGVQGAQANQYGNSSMSANPSSGSQIGQQRRGQQNQNSQANRSAAQNGSGIVNNLPSASVDELPQDIIDLMMDGWLDEQHAYAAYESIMEQFGQAAPFASIQQAETQHAAAWEALFARYGIAVPDVPEFDIPEFASLQAACELGAEAEIANFALYDAMLAAFAPYPDLYQVALALRNASEFNHLPAFQTCAGS